MVDRKLQLHFLLILLLSVFVLTFFIIKPFILTVILAGIFSIVVQPLHKKILATCHGQKTITSLITVIITFFCLLIPFFIISTQVFKESVDLYGSVVRSEGSKNFIISTIDGIGLVIDTFMPGTGEYFARFSNNLDTYTKEGLTWIIGHLGVVLTGLSVWLLDIFIFVVSLYYLIRDGKGFLRILHRLSPLSTKDMDNIFDHLHIAVNSVIRGNILIALLQGTMTAIGFVIFGVPNALLWGSVAVLTALIPGVGTGLVIVPGILYLVVVGKAYAAIGLIAWGTVIVGLIDNLLRPKLVGNALSIHPLLIFLSIIGGLFLFGPIGLFLGPITMSLLFAFINIYGDMMEKTKKIKKITKVTRKTATLVTA